MFRPRYLITDELLHLIALVTEIKVWITQAVVDVTWLPRLQRDTAARLAHSSTAIEGNPLTLPEVEALARGEAVGASRKVAQEVLNYLAAMRWTWQKGQGTPIEESQLLYLHHLLTYKTLPNHQVGRYKTRQNRVVDAQGHVVYIPPPPEKVGSLVRELLTWIKSPHSKKVHPIIVSAIAHHRLVSIHPFMDGNGRAARALSIWLLYTRGFDTHHLFALDEFYEQDRERYYEKIQQVRELDDDLTYWLEYTAEAVVSTLDHTKQRISSLEISAGASQLTLTKRQEEVLRFLRDRGRVKSSSIQAAFKLTRARVSQILKPLVDFGLVIRKGQTRAVTYQLA